MLPGSSWSWSPGRISKGSHPEMNSRYQSPPVRGSVMKAVEAARGKGCEIAFVLAIVDRLEGGRENLAAEGLELKAIYDRHDFV